MSKANSDETGVFLHAAVHAMSLWPGWVWILLVVCVGANATRLTRPNRRRR